MPTGIGQSGHFAGFLAKASLQMDLSAPEELGPNATSHLTETQGGQVLAYTLERIAAEKLRLCSAFGPILRDMPEPPTT